MLTGPNGSGKTTVLEAIAYLGSQRSFRTSQRESMVRTGAPRAIVRAMCTREGRPLLIESELPVAGPTRTLLNRQATRGRALLASALPVSVFSPDDLGIVQGAPARRREVLDATVRITDGRAAELLDDLDRVLRQRGALLRQAGGRLSSEIATSLEVWDERLARCGEAVAAAREALVCDVGGYVAESYEQISAASVASLATGASSAAAGPRTTRSIVLGYRRSWEGPLLDALSRARAHDLRRATSTLGPHRDELAITIDGRDSRVAASQGEQRTLALALRLGIHRHMSERLGAPPLLLLDDVFSELDPARSLSLVEQLPAGQALLTTAGDLPPSIPVGALADMRTLGQRP